MSGSPVDQEHREVVRQRGSKVHELHSEVSIVYYCVTCIGTLRFFVSASRSLFFCFFFKRTPRFAVAYWEDGKFWYLYNPYRCDKLGFFSWDGYACLSKHCSKEALKRHLMILILRAYAYSSTSKKPKNDSEDQKSNKSKKSRGSSIKTEQDSNEIKTFSIRIYQFVYHSCNIHNVKLLTKKPREEAKKGEEPLVDHYTHLGAVNCEDFDDKEITEDVIVYFLPLSFCFTFYDTCFVLYVVHVVNSKKSFQFRTFKTSDMIATRILSMATKINLCKASRQKSRYAILLQRFWEF